jgi:hypothetical protein
MYRRLGGFQPAQEEQNPGKSIRQRSGPEKGETGWESLEKARWKQTAGHA